MSMGVSSCGPPECCNTSVVGSRRGELTKELTKEL